MSENLGQKILDKIKQNSLEPTPRWHFLLKEWLVWLLGGLSLLIGAAAVSVMIYLSKNSDLFIYDQVGRSFSGWLLLSLPYFWIIFLALFVWILFYNIKHTKRGYRYPLFLVALFSILASILLGSIFSLVGLGEKVDDVLGRQAPFYDIVFNPHVDIWSHPEEGRLSGLVVSREDKNNFVLLDRSQSEWQVFYNGKNDGDQDDFVVVGQPVRAIGEIVGEHSFSAQTVMAMRPGREFFRRLSPEVNAGMNGRPGKGQAACRPGQQQDPVVNILEQYPELKLSLEQGLLENKQLISEIAGRDDNFLRMLQSLNINQEVLESLLAQ